MNNFTTNILSFLSLLFLPFYSAADTGVCLPITFEDTTQAYTVTGFGGADFGAISTEIIANPDMSEGNMSARVWTINKPAGAQVWAGASMPLDTTIDLSNGPMFSLKVWAPRAGTPIQLKFEDTTSPPDDNGNPSIIAEVVVNTTMAGAWETLTYDMSMHPGYNAANNYNQVVIFPDFGNMGVTDGEDFYIDDIQSAGSDTPEMASIPISFEDTSIAYNPGGFGSASFESIPTEIIDNPDPNGENTSMRVWSINKTEGAQVWAGASIALGQVVDLSAGTLFTVKVWSPRAGVPILLKFEDTTSPRDGNGNPTIINEVTTNTTTSSAWETLEFDLTSFGNYTGSEQFNQVVVFPDFGTGGQTGGETYYIDDISNTGSVSIAPFEDVRFNVFPNPTTDVLQVRYELPVAAKVDLQLIDAMGRAILREELGPQSVGSKQQTLQVPSLVKGTYFLLIKMDGQVVQQKTVIVQ